MADETGAAGSQAEPTTQPQAGTSSPSQVEGAQTGQAPSAAAESGTGDVSALQRQLDEARREAAKTRTELKRLTDAQKAADDAKLSETERLTKRLTELEQEREALITRQQEQSIRMATVTAAARLGFADPEDAFALLDRSAIEMDDAGEPRNVSRLLGELLKAKPYLAAAAARPTGSADGGARGTPSLKEQAAAAERAGDLRSAISIKSQQLLATRK